ncbi:aldehyde dehydrogenase family protein [Nocardia sp. NPDC004340]
MNVPATSMLADCPAVGPLLIVQSYVGGQDLPSPHGRNVHTVSTRALLEDAGAALALKRDADLGTHGVTEADSAIAGAVALADADQLELALAAAAAAAPGWAAVPLTARLAVGQEIATSLRRHIEPLTAILVAEGQPVTLARNLIETVADVTFSEDSLRWCAEQFHSEDTWGNHRRIVRRVPDGVVCVNPPQNSALANALFGLTAMLAGNAVVVRAPRGVPLAVMYALRYLVAPILEAAGAPAGTMNVLCGPPMMRTWLESPHVDSIVFIGGSAQGMALEQQCVAAGKKPILELAGNDCSIVWKDADIDAAVASAAEFFTQSGQICNLPNQLIVHPDIAGDFLERLVAATGRIRPGFPDDPDVVLTPVLQPDTYFRYIRDAVAHGARLRTGGRHLDVHGNPCNTGLFLDPAVLEIPGISVAESCAAVENETFVPLLPVIVPTAADHSGTDDSILSAMLRLIRRNRYGLRNSLWARDEQVIARFLEAGTDCGQLKINSPHSSFVPRLPTHGGTGLTGGAFGEANYLMLRTTRLQGIDHVVSGGDF